VELCDEFDVVNMSVFSSGESAFTVNSKGASSSILAREQFAYDKVYTAITASKQLGPNAPPMEFMHMFWL
jgi:hypothetical protein